MNDLQKENRQIALVNLYLQTQEEKYLAELFEEVNGLIYSLAYEFNHSNSPYELEDWVIEGRIVLVSTLGNFDDSEEAKYSTFIYTVIRNRFISISKKNHAVKRDAGNYTTLESPAFDNITYHEMIALDESKEPASEVALEQSRNEIIYLILNRCKPEDALLLLHEYFNLERELICEQYNLTIKQYRDKRRKMRMQILAIIKK